MTRCCKSVGRDDRLWHLKNSDLPNAVSQSLRIQLTLNSDTDCRFQIRKHSIGGSRGALAHKMPLLTKRREPKPTNSAYAEFANQNAGFIGGKTFQGGNRHTIPRIRLRRILEFWHRAFAQTMSISMPKRLSLEV